MKELAKKLFVSYYRLRGSYPARLAGLDMKGDPDHATFFRNASRGRWEAQTLKIIPHFLKPDHVYCDIGAWIGPTVMLAAPRCRLAYAFEPDRHAYEYLLANIRLNRLRNVVPFNMALSSETSVRQLAAWYEWGDSTTSLLASTEGRDSITIPCLAWETFLQLFKPEKMDFIKIDIEGGEFDLLPKMRPYFEEHRPIVYLSTHAPHLGPDGAAAGMKSIADTMRGYKCLSEDLAEIPLSALEAKENVEGYKAFVFIPN